MGEVLQGRGAELPLPRTQEMAASSGWLVSMRWLAGSGVAIATWLIHHTLLPEFAAVPMYVVAAVILAANVVFRGWQERLRRGGVEGISGYRRLTHLQLGLDWVAMVILIHLTGGVESPLVFLFVFHIVVASLVFERWIACAYAASAVALTAGLALAESRGAVAHLHVRGFLPAEVYAEPAYEVVILVALAAIGAVTWAVTSTVAVRVRRREDQLATLYGVVRAINSTLELPQVLDRLVRATVEAMGVQGASIGLLDTTGTQVEMAASYGLSEAYLNKGPVLVSQSRAHERALIGGAPAIIQNEKDRARLQYPAAAEAENIRSMLFVPLRGKGQALGVVRAYSSREEAFGPDDVKFLEAIAAQGAIAMENAMAYQAMCRMDEQKSKFTRTVTHELRAPVSGAQTLVSLIIDGYAGPLEERQAGFLLRLRRRLETLQMLIDDLLSLAAGRTGLAAEEVTAVVVGDVVAKVVSQIEPQAEGKRQTLELERDPEPLAVEASVQGLGRVFSNLIGNAVKYTPEGGRVAVSVRRQDHQVIVRVTDSGIGIPAQSLPRLFAEFFRAPNAIAVETGTGLGLVIVRELVERFRGRVAVESQEGVGSTFTVYLPLVGH